MRRRHLRLPSTSDEEEDDSPQVPPNFNDNPVPHPNPNPAPLEISDDDFVDVPDSFSSPSPPVPPVAAASASAVARSVDESLRLLGLALRLDWLDSCLSALAGEVPGFDSLAVEAKSRMCFEEFLVSDMNYSGAGVLPEDVPSMHKAELKGPFVLQVDEIVNISSPLRERYHDAPAGSKRCLKLSMTDGHQRIFGMEYRPIKEIEVLAPAGLKVLIRNIHVRRGLLMLVPEVLEVLGGIIEELDAARRRLVDEVNKPPRGRRNQQILPLSQRASLAAWPSNATVNTVQTATSVAQSVTSPQPVTYGISTLHVSSTTNNTAQADNSVLQSVTNHQTVAQSISVFHLSSTNSTVQANNLLPQGVTNPEQVVQDVPTLHMSRTSYNVVQANPPILHSVTNPQPVAQAILEHGNGEIFVEEFEDPLNREDTIEEFVAPRRAESLVVGCSMPHAIQSNVKHVSPNDRESITPHANAENRRAMEHKTTFGAASYMGDVQEVQEAENPLILSGDKEIPFTYLASLLAKWTAEKDKKAAIQGKIKCILTGVKGFQFKQRSTFELQVYVDDGSLISEVLIDHHAVRRGIGHTPEEVTEALSSSDKNRVAVMRETMKNFQLFLAKFEGTMLIQISEGSSLPVALEMNHGCPASDAWLLLRRLKMFIAPETSEQHNFGPIELSP